MNENTSSVTIGAVLAGGLSRRMSGPEKSLLLLEDKPLIQHVCERLQGQLNPVIINANGEPERFSFMQNAIQPDIVEGFAGPLAGVLSAMHWAKLNSPSAKRIITVAADTPFFPQNLIERFDAYLTPFDKTEKDQTICMAYSAGNRHPVFGSWPIHLFDELEDFLVKENERKVMLFAQRYSLIKVEFEFETINNVKFDPFFNINTPEDFEAASVHMKAFNG